MTNLAQPADRSRYAPESPWRDELAPAAQPSLFASTRAQRGLDGRWYEQTEATPPEGGETEPSLGPQHGLWSGPLAPAPAGAEGPVQLRLNLADVELYPQLGLWEQLDQAAALHARAPGEVSAANVLPGARGFESRACKCHRTRRKKGSVKGKRTERGAWLWSGLVTCDLWTCPLCGRRRARETSAVLGVAIDRHLKDAKYTDPRYLDGGRYHDAWMLTPTIPHVAGDLVGVTVERLFIAWKRFTRSKEWKAFRKRWQLRPVVRVLDATFGGPHGAHPHFHVLLLPKYALDWSLDGDEHLYPVPHVIPLQKTDVRDARLRELALGLWPAWDAACAAAGVKRARGANALELTGAEQARGYFLEWGLADEVGATTSKLKSHLRLLDAAAAGDERAAAAFTEWCAAVDGRQWVTGLADLATDMNITENETELWLAELRAQRDEALRLAGTPVVLVRPLDVEIPEYLYPTALRVGWAKLHKLLDDADERGLSPQMALVDELLVRYRARGQPP
jgi:hypothetical protein